MGEDAGGSDGSGNSGKAADRRRLRQSFPNSRPAFEENPLRPAGFHPPRALPGGLLRFTVSKRMRDVPTGLHLARPAPYTPTRLSPSRNQPANRSRGPHTSPRSGRSTISSTTVRRDIRHTSRNARATSSAGMIRSSFTPLADHDGDQVAPG